MAFHKASQKPATHKRCTYHLRLRLVFHGLCVFGENCYVIRIEHAERAVQPLKATIARDVCERCRVSVFRDVRHDLAHLHGLARRDFLDSNDDLIVWRAGGVLKQLPELGQQPALIFGRAARAD